jgi:hypothetical protein
LAAFRAVRARFVAPLRPEADAAARPFVAVLRVRLVLAAPLALVVAPLRAPGLAAARPVGFFEAVRAPDRPVPEPASVPFFEARRAVVFVPAERFVPAEPFAAVPADRLVAAAVRPPFLAEDRAAAPERPDEAPRFAADAVRPVFDALRAAGFRAPRAREPEPRATNLKNRLVAPAPMLS